MLSLLRLLRFPNLVVIALTQWLVGYYLLGLTFAEAEVSPVLSGLELGCLIAATVLVSAAGYVYNDLVDLPIDLINRPERVLVGRVFSNTTTHWLTVLLWGAGLVVSTYLAWRKNELGWLWLYPAFGGLLLLYPRYLKSRPLAGNLFIALCCASTAGLVWLAERSVWAVLPSEKADSLAFIIVLFMAYAFLATWIRELIKDLEDLPGDQAIGRRTFPALYGTHRARRLIQLLTLILLACLVLTLWQPWLQHWQLGLALGGVTLLLLTCYLAHRLQQAQTVDDYRTLSRQWKFFLLGGLGLMLIHGWGF